MAEKLRLIHEEECIQDYPEGTWQISAAILEQPPQKRCIRIAGGVFYLAFPYSQFCWIKKRYKRNGGRSNDPFSFFLNTWSRESWSRDVPTYLPCLPNRLSTGNFCLGEDNPGKTPVDGIDLFWRTAFTLENDMWGDTWNGILEANWIFARSVRKDLVGYCEWERRTRANLGVDWFLGDSELWVELPQRGLVGLVRTLGTRALMSGFEINE